ncbi:uncharacterized protein F5147DRAFT_659953 [Suillus discolor]|uniref:Uncharacterized protein n=1 Tax=Suillus discolor TaxID=1912936 RepID=A0A9P7JL43_9AGAM|nr:uncharacterized protein F5147DRAFT_659953 [Suillus discolor]KAG2084072.1 hypothetical protein F5147DRAFT_659953 [Suillus discolor]
MVSGCYYYILGNSILSIYAEPVMLTNGHEDHLVPMRRINDPALVTFVPSNDVNLNVLNRPELYGSGWEELVHPLGGTYYYHNKKNTYTSMNIWHMDRQRLKDFINVSRAVAKEDKFHMTNLQVRRTCREILCYLGDQMRQVDTQLASVENGVIEDTGVVLCLIEKPRTCKALYFVSNTAATILCMPITIDHIRNTSIDGIVNGVDIRTFIDDFSGQAKSQITLAGVSVAMDVTILAIPGLGTTLEPDLAYQTGILLAKEDDDVDHHYKYTNLLLCTEVSVAADFKPSTPLMITCFTMLGVVICFLLVLVVASYSPGLSRTWPQ